MRGLFIYKSSIREDASFIFSGCIKYDPDRIPGNAKLTLQLNLSVYLVLAYHNHLFDWSVIHPNLTLVDVIAFSHWMPMPQLYNPIQLKMITNLQGM